ncbi:MAG: glutamate--tRNA ligase [Nanoarchaeota archaeon]
MDRETTILAFALQNALRYEGKANPGAIVGRVIADLKAAKEDLPKIAKEVQDVVKKVNAMTKDEQHALLEKIAPEFLEKKEKKHDLFAFLDIKDEQKIVTAFPPEPSKYPHIGHAKAVLLNYELAKRYDGKFIIRFEDTNPELALKEYYDIHLENYAWLGVKADKVTYASDNMAQFYDKIRKLLKDGNAYVCSCAQEQIKAGRESMEPCGCREKPAKEALALFKDMEKAAEGSFVIRAKIDLGHKNSTMRDPTLMRIIDKPHARTGTKYRMWPTYDFENAVMDGSQGITHRLRSKEFEMRSELQHHLQRILGLPETFTYEFARFNLEGVESSGRIIREMIAKEELWGWDDPSLTTLVALRRRGFQPEAIKSFVLATGISKNEATLTWDDLIVHNRRLLDGSAERYSFVSDPVALTIDGAPELHPELQLHPSGDKGTRQFTTGSDFLITQQDAAMLKEGKLYRLMGCLNFEKHGKTFAFASQKLEDYKGKGEAMIHWLPKEGNITAQVLMPDHTVVKGLAEPAVAKLSKDQVVQFERFGFCRLDNPKTMTFWFTHK